MDVNRSAFCIESGFITSTGIWVDDSTSPLDYAFTLLIAQISVIFVATRITHLLLAPLGQPQVVSHVTAGIILGPSLLGRHERFTAKLFPPWSWTHLNILALLAYILFTFMIGVKTDLRIIRRSGRKAVVIGWSGYLLSYTFGCLVSLFYLGDETVTGLRSFENFGFLSDWSVTFHPVLVCLLAEHNLLTSKLGRLAMSASLAIDFQTMILTSLISVPMAAFWMTKVVYALLVLALVFGLIIFVARPVVVWMVRRTPEGEMMGEGYFVTVILIVLWCGLVVDMIGLNIATGGFLLGVVLPGGPPLGRTLVERLDRLVSGLLLPLYYAVAGLKVDLKELVHARKCWNTALFLVACSMAKQGGVAAAGAWYGLSFKDALALGLMLNCYGIVHLSNFMIWLQEQDERLVPESYTLSVLMVLCVSGITAGLLKHVYNPSSQFASYRRLSIEQTGRTEELRVLACAHDDHNAAPVISILESSLPNPMCVYLLHLVPLVGQSNTILAPYKLKSNKKKSYHSSITDHIVNIFRSFEYDNPGRVSILPFIAISPYSSMHNDICQLAIDKKIALIILPFHKSATVKKVAKYVNPAEIRVMNVNVLLYAPCSVAIFVDRGFSHKDIISHHVAVYFFGGADDREALAYATTMVDNNSTNLTLFRLVLPQELREWNREDLLDDEAVEEFIKFSARSYRRVEFREEVVRDGSETMEVVRATSEFFGLLIVGRRDGMNSILTAGLEMWSEYPELGVIGDLLASTDFGAKASTLVVQQQPSVGGEGRVMLCARNSNMIGEQ